MTNVCNNFVCVNSTFANNSGGIRFDKRAANRYARNSIFYDNRRKGGDLANLLFTDSTVTVTFDYCCMNELPAAKYLGTGNIAADPEFVSPETGDFRLQRGSPCINTGQNEAWMLTGTDLDGKPRLDSVRGIVDMGCYEHVPSGAFIVIR